jgi:hypothetical protein
MGESAPSHSVFQVPSSELVGSNQTELVTKLNENISATNPAFVTIAISCFTLLLVPSYPFVGSTFVAVGFLLSVLIWRSFRDAHTHDIHYALDDQAKQQFARKETALASLASCSRVWLLSTRSATSDRKRNAGAGTLISRKPVRIGALATKGFKSSLAISSIEADQTTFHFLPDQILLFSRNRYTSIQYDQLSVDIEATRFIETEAVPQDSQQIDTTWQYVNKGGEPDRRFNNNRQIPIVRYGELRLHNTAGLNVILQTSNVEKGQVFASTFSSSSNNGPTSAHSSNRNLVDPVPPSLLECYATLGLTRPTTLELASAAHRQQAALYHPDKYEHLAPEMQKLASARMVDINAAYSRVVADINR